MADSPIGTQPPRADLMADILQANEAPSSDVANIRPSNNVHDVDKDRTPIKILSKIQRTRNAGNSVFGTKPTSPVRSLHVLACLLFFSDSHGGTPARSDSHARNRGFLS